MTNIVDDGEQILPTQEHQDWYQEQDFPKHHTPDYGHKYYHTK